MTDFIDDEILRSVQIEVRNGPFHITPASAEFW